jgi:hypothetical protein
MQKNNFCFNSISNYIGGVEAILKYFLAIQLFIVDLGERVERRWYFQLCPASLVSLGFKELHLMSYSI